MAVPNHKTLVEKKYVAIKGTWSLKAIRKQNLFERPTDNNRGDLPQNAKIRELGGDCRREDFLHIVEKLPRHWRPVEVLILKDGGSSLLVSTKNGTEGAGNFQFELTD